MANQQIKTAFATNGIILNTIHWKIAINLIIISQKLFTNQISYKLTQFRLVAYPIQYSGL